MSKMIIGLIGGILFTGLLYNMGILSIPPTMAQSDNTSLTETLPEDTVSSYEALTLPLRQAGADIRDEEIAQYYQKLRLKIESTSLTENLPDIKTINNLALTLPLQEAGKNIKDKELAEFYHKLLEDAGLTIESD